MWPGSGRHAFGNPVLRGFVLNMINSRNEAILEEMKIIYNNVIPFKGFTAINLFGILFARRE